MNMVLELDFGVQMDTRETYYGEDDLETWRANLKTNSTQEQGVPKETLSFFDPNPVYNTPAPKFDGNYVVADTGAKRSNRSGKGRYDLIPPRALERVAKVYEAGANEHGDWNWAKGMKMSRLLDSATRHINQYRDGDRTEDHLAQAVWNLLGTLHFEEHMPEMNDLTNFKAMRDEFHSIEFVEKPKDRLKDTPDIQFLREMR
jgi:hypothetical protein